MIGKQHYAIPLMKSQFNHAIRLCLLRLCLLRLCLLRLCLLRLSLRVFANGFRYSAWPV